MLPLVVLSALLVVSSAAPGGYTGLGGLYKNMNQNADYMPHAKNAAKLATQIAFEEDESLVGGQVLLQGISPQSCTETDFEMKTSNFVLFLLILVVSVHFRAMYDETIRCQA